MQMVNNHLVSIVELLLEVVENVHVCVNLRRGLEYIFHRVNLTICAL